jgi:hypothetical protein
MACSGTALLNFYLSYWHHFWKDCYHDCAKESLKWKLYSERKYNIFLMMSNDDGYMNLLVPCYNWRQTEWHFGHLSMTSGNHLIGLIFSHKRTTDKTKQKNSKFCVERYTNRTPPPPPPQKIIRFQVPVYFTSILHNRVSHSVICHLPAAVFLNLSAGQHITIQIPHDAPNHTVLKVCDSGLVSWCKNVPCTVSIVAILWIRAVPT